MALPELERSYVLRLHYVPNLVGNVVGSEF